MKLGNFFTGNVFTITQSPHGALQGGKAIDCVPTSGTRVIAPCDMEIYYRKNDLGHQSYSYARGTGFRIIFVHAIIEKTGFVKRGTDIGYLATGGALHLHTAIEVNGVWDTVLNYMERTIELRLASGFSSQHWKSWSTWKDLSLNTNNMTFNYELYVKNNNLYMRVLSGSINANATVRNVTKGTSWQVFCNKSVGNDGGAINTGMEEALYEVIASGIVRQFDNRPAPVDPCKTVKDELASALRVIDSKNSEINKLNGALGGMTTDRNKYKSLSEELQAKFDGETAETNRLKIELEGIKKELTDTTLKLDMANNELDNVAPKIQGYEKELEVLRTKVTSQSLELTRLNEIIKKNKENKGTTLVEFLQSLIDKVTKR